MKVDEINEQLVEELRRLRREVTALSARVQQLEGGAGVEAPPPPEEREGDFGPAIKRASPDRHRSAVSKALSMLGVLPAAPAETRHSVQRAIHKARTLGQPEADNGEAAETPKAAETPQAAETQGEWIPLPELRRDHDDEGFVEADAAPVELGNAIAVDLKRPLWTKPLFDVGFLLLEVAFLAGLLVWLPGIWGVLASLAFIVFLSAPWWGYLRPLLHAHARFFSLLVMIRCVMPDIVTMGVPEMWLNPRFFTMLAACLPALWIVTHGRHGWVVQAVAMAAVAGCAAGAEFGSWIVTLSIFGFVLGAAITLRSLPSRGVSAALPRVS